MVKRLLLGIFTLLLAGTAIGTGAFLASPPDTAVDRLLARPGILAVLEQQTDVALASDSKTTDTPLVQQAKRFGLYLDPPPPPPSRTPLKPVIAKAPLPRKLPSTPPPVRPRASAPKFEVVATCIYKSRPEKSMALISEPGADERWVKASELVGHVLIEEIRKSQVCWRDGERTGQVAAVTPKQKRNEGDATVRLVSAQPKTEPAPLLEKQELKQTPSTAQPTPIRRGLRPRR
ncbi:hypothetical protein ACFL6U_32905 [Planctomycetota bacterium]